MAQMMPRGLARPFMPLLVLLGMLAALLAAPATLAAKDMEAADKTAVLAAIDRFDSAMRQKDYDTVIEASVPQAIIRQIANAYGLDEKDWEQFKAVIKQQMAAALKMVELVEFGMDRNAIAFSELPDGSYYGLIPTHTVLAMDGKKFRASSQTLALKDDGRWYLMRVEGGQQGEFIRKAYPQFKDVVFTAGTMEEIGK
jgi:hypothetical protein